STRLSVPLAPGTPPARTVARIPWKIRRLTGSGSSVGLVADRMARVPADPAPWPPAAALEQVGGGRGDRLRAGDLARERCQVAQCAGIDPALERHHVFHRVPEVDPAPVVELRLGGQVQAQVAFLPGELQQVPDLLLADAHHLVVAPDGVARQPVAQPARG